jgi:ADP-heptose:LPS heptosyltransferase
MQPHRILVLAEGQLGDLLLLTPALRALKESFPQALLAVCVVQRRSYASGGNTIPPLLAANPAAGTTEAIAPFADEIIEVFRPTLRQTHGPHRLGAEWTLLRRIRAGKYDTVVSCFPEDRFAVWAVLSGARRRVGQNHQPLATLYTDRPEVRKEEGGVLQYYCALAAAAGATVRSLATEFVVSDEEKEEAGRLLATRGISVHEKYAVIHPGASGPYRVWPPERFARVAEVLQVDHGIRCLLCGTMHDHGVLEAVRSHLCMKTPEVVLEGSVRTLAAILARASLCLSNDSGPRHLAIAVGTPSVAILPKHNDRAWGIYQEGPGASYVMSSTPCPLCPPGHCLDRHPEGEEFGSACIRMVSVEEVLARIRRVLPVP